MSLFFLMGRRIDFWDATADIVAHLQGNDTSSYLCDFFLLFSVIFL